MRSQASLALLSSILMIALLSCSPTVTPSSPPPPSPTPKPEQVTITWAFWGDPWEVEINEQVVKVFEADYPHIQIETFHRPWNDYFTELRAKLEAGDPVPDVLFWSEPANDRPENYFMSLTPFIEAEKYNLDDFFPGLLIHFKIGDNIYGLPRDSDTKVIFYNKRLFNQADLAYPQSGWRWNDLREISLTLKAANVADYSFAYEANDWWMIWMWQNGVQLFDDKMFPTQTNLGEPAAVEAVQFLAHLTNVDQVTPPYQQLNSADIAALFIEEKLAMAFGNHALVPAFAEIDNFEWDVVGLPQQQRRANLTAGAGYVISAKTTHPEAAWTFLKFLVSPKGQAVFAESGVIIPARRSVARSNIFMNQRAGHNMQIFLDEAEIGEPNFSFPRANDIMGLMNEALVPVWRGEQDAASAIESVVPQIEAIVAEVNKQPSQ